MQQDMSYITTMDRSYEVKIARFGARKQFFRKMLGDAEALAAAIRYRDSLYVKYGIGPRHSDKPNVYFNSRNGKGSISGVSLSIEEPQAYFVAKIHDGERWTRKRFSIKKLGYVNAFRGAVIARLENFDMGVDAHAIEVQRPTMEQFIFLCTLAKDVPLPVSNLLSR
jgi:hypothetical protein